MRKFVQFAAALLAFAIPGTAMAQHHGDRGGWSGSHDAPRGHDRDYRPARHSVPTYDHDRGYRSSRHGVPNYGYDRGYRGYDPYYRGYDRRYERRDRYERRYQKRRQHHHHRGRHWRG